MNPETELHLSPQDETEIQTFLDEHPGITRGQLIKHLGNQQNLKAAASAPHPGPLHQAYCGSAKTVLGYELQPISLALLSALERLELPFLAMIDIICESKDKTPAELGKEIESKIRLTIDQQLAAIWCFTTPLRQIETELKHGKDQVIENVRNNIGAKHHPRDLGKLNSAIILHYVESYSTVVNYEPQRIGEPQSFPSAPPQAKTA